MSVVSMSGTKYLWEPELRWPQISDDYRILPKNDPDVKKLTNIPLIKKDTNGLDRLLSQVSSLMKLEKITVWIRIFTRITQ